MIVGGMPQVVGRYVETRDFNAVDEEKRLIIKEKAKMRDYESAFLWLSEFGYTTKSLEKCANKFGEYVTQPTVLHCSDMKSERGKVYMPLYMTELLGQ